MCDSHITLIDHTLLKLRALKLESGSMAIIGYFRVSASMEYDCSPIYYSRGSDGSFVFFYILLCFDIIHAKK